VESVAVEAAGMISDPTELPAMQRVVSPAAWRAADLAEPAAYIYELTPRDIEELGSALRRAVSLDLDPARLDPSKFPLLGLGVSLRAIGRELETGCGFHLVRGIPVESCSLSEAEIMLCGIGAHLGRLMPQNSKGEVINHVRNLGLAPTQGNTVRGYQNCMALPFHSDSCDVVGLLCMRDAKSGGESAVASSYAIHNVLLSDRPGVLRSLYLPFHIDRIGEESEGEMSYYSTPVFMWHHGRLFSRFNPGYVYAAQRYVETPRLTAQQIEAMEIFAHLCASDQFHLKMKLKPGDLQLLNNNVLIHSRSAYEDYAEPEKKRHLLRLWLFTSGIDDIPAPMRDRYRDMEAWQVNAHVRLD
jgi:hypothetical protein